MEQASNLCRKLCSRRFMLTGLTGLFLLWRLCLMALSIAPLDHDPQDSYTLQALAWRAGQTSIEDNAFSQDLELAVYNDRLYVSFPPVPTIPLWLLTFVYDWATPNRLVNLFYFLSSYLIGYSICKRFGKTDGSAAIWAVFLTAGCNLLNLCWFGGVWYQAQALSFLLTLLCFRLLLLKTAAANLFGLGALALAVGCRPFQLVYFLPALFMVFRQLYTKDKHTLPSVFARLFLFSVPALLIGIGYGLYNLIRFDNFFEFGHTYLPEFQMYGSQFSLSYLSTNLSNVFRLPWYTEQRLYFPYFNGFAFYLANPLFVIALAALVRRIFKKRIRTLDTLLVICLALHFFLLLTHRTFGGWQFGTRYLIDLCPALFLLSLRQPLKTGFFAGTIMLWGVLFNLYGGLLFHLS